jgi:CxxC motif-containing protein (DUF1111 family)
MVIKVGVPGRHSDGSPKIVRGIGNQLQDQDLNGKKYHSIRLSWSEISGRYPDGTKYKLRKPNLRFNINSNNQRKYLHSLRMTPGIIGPGLIEAIPAEQILANADPRDTNRDGISGRVNYVINKISNQKEIGKFGFKSTHPTDEQQSAAALFGDMGVSTSIFKNSDGSIELSESELLSLVVYQKLSGVPRPRNQNTNSYRRGRFLFSKIGCDSCHKFGFTTSSNDTELNNQTIHPLSDFLLHDMGSGLADNYREFDAAGREWRTTPLWGLGFLSTVGRTRQHYLHDGRARTIEEAIIWHDGEAKKSKDRFMRMTRKDRAALLYFLKSL